MRSDILNIHQIFIRFYSVIAPGDTVNVIGEFDDQGKCDVGRENNLLIVHPDILVSGTRVIDLYLSQFHVHLWKLCCMFFMVGKCSRPLLIRMSVDKICDCLYLILAGTYVNIQVAASFSCSRRSVLDERLKCSEQSSAALIGTLLHQIFQVP